MKILITTSSGGHFTLAEAIAEDYPDDKVVIVNSKKNEKTKYVLPKIREVGKPLWISPIKLIKNFLGSIKILKKENPDLIINTGTALGFFISLLGKLSGKEIVGVEPNDRLLPSKGIKIVSWFADEIWLPQKELKIFYKKGKVVGFKFPKRMYKARKYDLKKIGLNPNKKTLLVTTGTWGSREILDCVVRLINLQKLEKYNIIINTGKISPAEVKKRITNKKQKAYITDFIKDFYSIVKSSDLVITRAGITPYELLELKKKIIIIPMEKSVDNHQIKTAEKLSKKMEAEIILEKNLNLRVMKEMIMKVLK